jgi:hypothetical protein
MSSKIVSISAEMHAVDRDGKRPYLSESLTVAPPHRGSGGTDPCANGVASKVLMRSIISRWS